MKNRWVCALVCGSMFAAPLVCAEQRTGELVVAGVITVNEFAPSIVIPPKCDLSGSISVRVAQLGGGRGPILTISHDGKKVTRFSTDTVPDLSQARIFDFAVDPFGKVYVLARQADGKIYIVRFANDGQYESKHVLEAPVQPRQIAVFKSGQLFIAGLEQPLDQQAVPVQQLNAKPFLGIFSESGTLLRKVAPKDDVEVAKKYTTPEAMKQVDRTYEEATVLSVAVAADDGYVYFMRRTPTGPVYVVSPSGTVIRRIILRPPKDGQLSSIAVANGRIVAKFLRMKSGSEGIESVILSVVDTQTNETYAEYSHSDFHIGSAFACYDQDNFTFLGNDANGRFTIIQAKGR